MRTDKAACNSEPEYKDLVSGPSEHKGAPAAAEHWIDPAHQFKVDPYQDPAYNQPHNLIGNTAVETTAVESAPREGVQAPAMQLCIDECFECHKICLTEAMHEGRETGELHPNRDFFRLMIGCAEVCQATANFLLTGSPLHAAVCATCAQNCEACATSCDEMGNLAACAAQCRKCADSCREIAQMTT